MINSGKLAGKTLFITGASRGIGKAIALKAARDGANVVIGAKTAEPHPKLQGTIFSAAEEIERAGGKCLPLQVDIRDEEQVKNAINAAVSKFGGLDILVNNASAISLTNTVETSMKKYDLMHSVNARGTFMCSKYAIEHLKSSKNGHILTLSPPLDMRGLWFKNHVAYSMAKYGMSMCVLGMSEELREHGIAVNALWPRTAIWTAAMEMLGGADVKSTCRKEEIMSDAGYAILCKDSKSFTGHFCVDEDVLRNEGITDFHQYAMSPSSKLTADFFLPDKYLEGLNSLYKSVESSSSQAGASSVGDGASSVGGDGDGGAAGKVFDEMSAKMTEDLKKQINAVMSFVISGHNWFVDAHSSRPFKVTRSDPETNPDVTFLTDEETFLKMAKGEVKAANAFMSGKLKVKGNLAIAMKAEKIFEKIRT